MDLIKLKKGTIKLANIINEENTIDPDIITPIIEKDDELKELFSKDSDFRYRNFLYVMLFEFNTNGKIDIGALEGLFQNIGEQNESKN